MVFKNFCRVFDCLNNELYWLNVFLAWSKKYWFESVKISLSVVKINCFGSLKYQF